MRQFLVSVLLVMVAAGPAFGQTSSNSSDSQTLRALLEEVRQLRHDLQATTTMMQRAQIALYRLQRQDEAVARAERQLSEARTKLAIAKTNYDQKVLQIQNAKLAASHSEAPDAQTRFEEVTLPTLKSELETLQKDEQSAQGREVEAEQQLRDEQTKPDGLNDTLDRLNMALEEASKK